jgi:hypothetical protein
MSSVIILGRIFFALLSTLALPNQWWYPQEMMNRNVGTGHPMLFLSRGKMKNVLKMLSFVKTAG